MKADALSFVSSCVIGIELSARTQVGLLGAEILTLIGLGFLLLGVVLMALWRIEHKDFLRRRTEVAGMPRAGPAVTE